MFPIYDELMMANLSPPEEKWWHHCSRTGTEPMVFISQIPKLYHACTKCTFGIESADVQGMVVSFTEREKYYHCAVDDGSGILYARCMKTGIVNVKDDKDRLMSALSCQVQRPAPPSLGQTLHMRGRLFRAHGDIEMITSEYRVVDDVMGDVKRINDVIDLHEKVYDTRVSLPNLSMTGTVVDQPSCARTTQCDLRVYRAVVRIIEDAVKRQFSVALDGMPLSRLHKVLTSDHQYRTMSQDCLLEIVDFLVEKSLIVWVGPYRYGLL